MRSSRTVSPSRVNTVVSALGLQLGLALFISIVRVTVLSERSNQSNHLRHPRRFIVKEEEKMKKDHESQEYLSTLEVSKTLQQSIPSSSSSSSSSKLQTFLEVGGLVSLWYFTAVMSVTSSKEIMNRVPFPFLLCAVQFAFASIFSNLFLQYYHLQKEIPVVVHSYLHKISFAYTVGFILTNWAFQIVIPAFAETVKSSEPITTVLIGWFLLNDYISTRTYLTLIPICIGIGISCYHDVAFSLIGFLLAFASNFGFSSRAVFAKVMNQKHPGAIDDFNMFTTISMEGLILLVPITILFEGPAIYQVLYEISNGNSETSSSSSSSLTTTSFSMSSLLMFFLFNGIMFSIYNLTSYVVLRKTDLITHSVLNAFRRVFIITFTTIWFHASLSWINVFGILLAIFGVVLFGYFKSLD